MGMKEELDKLVTRLRGVHESVANTVDSRSGQVDLSALEEVVSALESAVKSKTSSPTTVVDSGSPTSSPTTGTDSEAPTPTPPLAAGSSVPGASDFSKLSEPE